ncbi:MAG: hypothetical protein AB2693_19210 [Candidatus Thiodiazotropha sp.]
MPAIPHPTSLLLVVVVCVGGVVCVWVGEAVVSMTSALPFSVLAIESRYHRN